MKTDRIYRVAYKGKSGGIVTYSDHKAIFPDRQLSQSVVEGIVEIDETTYMEKEHYKFAKMSNIETVEPTTYGSLAFYNGIGVPTTIHKGKYGSCVFFKETYYATTYIKAYTLTGEVIVKEFMDNKKGKGAITYRQIDEVVTWTDITSDIHARIMGDLDKCLTTPTPTDLDVLCTIKPIEKVDVIQSEKGYLIACGKFESMVAWKDDKEKVRGTWVGRLLTDTGASVKGEMIDYMSQNFLINENMHKCHKVDFELPNVTAAVEKLQGMELIKAYPILFNCAITSENSLLFIQLQEDITQEVLQEGIAYVKAYNGRVLAAHSQFTNFKRNWKKAIYQC